MKIARPELLPASLTYAEAVQFQQQLRQQVCLTGPVSTPRWIAGVDASYNAGPLRFRKKTGDPDKLYAAVVVLELPSLRLVESASVTAQVSFPYIPGLLSFREVPPLIEAFRKLSVVPDVVLVDGQGIAHPRRCGLASHLGLVLDLPAIGCGKSRLVGEYKEPAARRGSASDLRDGGELIGRVLRTRDRVSPIFVSVGHKIALDDAVEVVLQCAPRFRVPEPTRQAHILVNELRRQENSCA